MEVMFDRAENSSTGITKDIKLNMPEQTFVSTSVVHGEDSVSIHRAVQWLINHMERTCDIYNKALAGSWKNSTECAGVPARF